MNKVQDVVLLMNKKLNDELALDRERISKLEKQITGYAYAFPTYTVATAPVLEKFAVAYISDGRKSGETVGNGTGVPCWFNEVTLQWLTFHDNTVVLA